ncbi:DUF3887 domain-containing protein [Pedobacter aquatilis]|uniref:DUF3887 domain-containing protein n=1 Tax=Pedobacter aquatilis TaxID=351343 RepID=UPI0029301905|nr:DUF3887 domain-containing protein [Pedobacter aquatilis]
MKRYLSIIIIISISNFAFAQKESPSNKVAAEMLSILYNKTDFKGVFEAFSPSMQAAMPLEKATDFFSRLMGQAGRINQMEFISYEKGYALYNTDFEKASLLVSISIDAQSKINGLSVRPMEPSGPALKARTSTLLSLPFKGEWTVAWGGDTREQNYHVFNGAQRHALDLVVTDEKGRSYRTDGKTNADYYAFGKELLAPCDGEVVLVVDGIKDNLPGTLNPAFVTGNTVVIRTVANEYLFFAHFKQRSILVGQGDRIKAGQLLGLCGNSGNSSEPHLHFHVQDSEDVNTGTGIKCFFEKVAINGQLRTDYAPVQKDRVRN